MKNSLRFVVLGASAIVLAQACGSEDGKKRQPGPGYGDGANAGEGGDGASSTGGTKGNGGTKPTAGSAGSTTTDGGMSTGEAGQSMSGTSGSLNGEAGMTTGDGGAGGQGSEPVKCPAGFDDCDGKPETVCEQDLTLITSCGACDVVCNATKGVPSCTDGKCSFECDTGYADCDANGDNGCEASLSSDEHCGSCERDCKAAGTTCSVDYCKEIPLQQGQPFGSDSSANRTWAFSPLGLLQAPFYSYAVRRYPLDGSATKVVWDSTNKGLGTESLLVVGDEIYWAEQGTSGDDFTSAVYKKSITAAADVLPTLAFAPEWKPTFLRKTGNALYWFSGDYQSGDPTAVLYTRALDAPLSDHGTKIMSVDQGTHNGMEAFQVTSNALYWISNKALTGTAYELRTTPLSGGAPSVVPAVSLAYPTTAVSSYGARPSLQAIGDTLYFNRNVNDAADGIYKFKTGDAAPQAVVLTDDVTSLLVDETFAYYTRQNVAGIWRAKLSGSAGTKVSGANVTKIVGQDEKFVYGIVSGCCAGSLFKIIK